MDKGMGGISGSREPGPETVPALSGFDPGRGSLNYRISWPRAATPCALSPLWAGEFRSFDDWVSFATNRLTGTTNQFGVEAVPICVDALGRRCIMGGDFMRARDEGVFPVRYFWECVPASVDRSPEGQDAEERLDRNDESAVAKPDAQKARP